MSESEVQTALGKASRAIKHCGDYGYGYYHHKTGRVWWVAGDADSPPDYASSNRIKQILSRVPGVKTVQVEYEAAPFTNNEPMEWVPFSARLVQAQESVLIRLATSLQEALAGGSWITIHSSEDGEGAGTHLYISKGGAGNAKKGTVLAGPSALVGSALGHLHSAPGFTVTTHPAGHTPQRATDHPAYREKRSGGSGWKGGSARPTEVQTHAALRAAHAETKTVAGSGRATLARLATQHGTRIADALLNGPAGDAEEILADVRGMKTQLDTAAERDAWDGAVETAVKAAMGTVPLKPRDPSKNGATDFSGGTTIPQAPPKRAAATPEAPTDTADLRRQQKEDYAGLPEGSMGHLLLSSADISSGYQPGVGVLDQEKFLQDASRLQGLHPEKLRDKISAAREWGRRHKGADMYHAHMLNAATAVQHADDAVVADLVKAATYPKLEGSEKQIDWAHRIRGEHALPMGEQVSYLRRRLTHLQANPDHADTGDYLTHAKAVEGVTKDLDLAERTFTRLFTTRTSTKNWIDQRDFDPIRHMEATVSYEEGQKRRAAQAAMAQAGEVYLAELGKPPPLTEGSSRQIDWAHGSIRPAHLKDMASHVASLYASGHKDAALAKSALKVMHGKTDAKYWIDRKDRTPSQWVDALRPKPAAS